MTDVVMSVPGVSCDACRQAIEGAVRGVPGVRGADVTVEACSVHVVFEPLAELDAIRAAIENEGYDIEGC